MVIGIYLLKSGRHRRLIILPKFQRKFRGRILFSRKRNSYFFLLK